MKVAESIPIELKGPAVGLGVVLAGALITGVFAPESKHLFRNPLLWVIGASSGLASAGWIRWNTPEASGSDTSTGVSAISRSDLGSTSLHEGSGFSGNVHPNYAALTERVGQHTISFPPGSDQFAEALRDGGKLLDHASRVYQFDAQNEHWQTISHTEGTEYAIPQAQDNHRRSSGAALPPSSQPTFQSAHHQHSQPELVQASNDDNIWQAEAESQGSEFHLDGASSTDDDLWNSNVPLNGKYS